MDQCQERDFNLDHIVVEESPYWLTQVPTAAKLEQPLTNLQSE